jgi:hypothetical protein
VEKTGVGSGFNMFWNSNKQEEHPAGKRPMFNV